MEKIQSKAFIKATEEKVYHVDKGVTRQFIAYDNNIMMVKVIFEQGAVGSVHTHPHVQTSYVVSGRFEVTIGDKMQILVAGDGFYAAPDMAHGVKCIEAGELLDVFTPIREDFYKTII